MGEINIVTSLFATKQNESAQQSTAKLDATSYLWRKTISISLCLVIITALLAFPLSYAINRRLDAVSSTTNLRQVADQLILTVIQQTEAERAYFLTRDKDVEAKFHQKTLNIEETLESLDKITSQNARWAAWFDEVKIEVLRRNELLQQLVYLSHNLPVVDKPATTPAIEDEIRVAQITKIILSFIEDEDYLLKANYEQLAQLRSILNYLALAGIILTFILAYFINQRLKHNISQLKSFQNQLAEENALLEGRVKSRTNELEIATDHAEKERQRVEFLLQDSSHRIGNSLATVSSLLSLQINQSKNEEAKSALIAARDHVQTIATAYRRLRLSEDLDTTDTKDFFETVINDIELLLPPEKRKYIAIEPQIENLQISSRDATTLAIITNELVTNAIKHAFTPNQAGKICITLTEQRDNMVNLVIEDNGKGFPADMAIGNSLGFLIISNLCSQFETQPIFENIENGGGRVTLTLKNLKIEPIGA